MLVSRYVLRLEVKPKFTAEVAPTAAQASRALCIDNGSTGLARLGRLDRWRWNRGWLLVDGAVSVASLATRATVYSLVLDLNEKISNRAQASRLTESSYPRVGLQGSWVLGKEGAKT